METKSFVVWVNGNPSPETGRFSREEAEKEAHRLADKELKEVFITECISIIPPKENTVNSYETACNNLGILFTPLLGLDLDNIGISNKHVKAISAIYKLMIIAEAWNKADEFVPNFDNTNQYKWFPWFRKQGTGGFVSANTNSAATSVYAFLGSRLCFKSEERATEFGEQFIDLWNDFLLIK
ncbi:MAG: hypothetical protein RR854_00290 [Muribaculaceae bacterium]